MITKGNKEKVQNEVLAQVLTDTSAKRMKFSRLFPKKELKEDSEYYTYFQNTLTFDEAVKKGELGEVKPIAPGVSLQELNVRNVVSKTVSINNIGGVLNINSDMLDKNIFNVVDMVKDVAFMIGASIEKEVYNKMFSQAITTKNNSASSDFEDYGEFIIALQEKLKDQVGNAVDLNTIAVNYKSMTALKLAMLASNKTVIPVETMKKYYASDAIDILGASVCDGGSQIGEKQYFGMDIRNPPMSLLYSKTAGTTIAPISQDGDLVDFYPLIEFMRKDIKDELPSYTKLFIQTRVGFLLNKPKYGLKGNFRV